MKLLIVTTEPEKSGGVANYYKTLQGKFSFETEYFIQGSRTDRDGVLNDIKRLIGDYKKFKNKITAENYDLILLNPSMDFKSIVRDAKFIQIAKKHSNGKLVLFWRGFLVDFFDDYVKKWFSKTFTRIFFKADAHIVLASKFKHKLQSIGCKAPIYCETTIVGHKLLRAEPKNFPGDRYNILFLARIVKTKGIYEAIETFRIVRKKFPAATLSVAGNGFELDNVKKYLDSNKVEGIIFLGDVGGAEKIKALENADVYLFPSYFEGMPNSVLEAMGMGLPVVTTNVGGLEDFFISGKMGFITDSFEPEILAGFIDTVFSDIELQKQISKTNAGYAASNFSLNIVVKRLEKILSEINTFHTDQHKSAFKTYKKTTTAKSTG